MANRVQDADVNEILHNPEVVLLTPFITAAHLVVKNSLVPLGRLDEATLKEIERWLAAHFASMHETLRQWSQNETGESMVRAVGKYGLGLDHTQYGQQAKVLDSTGTLDTLSKPRARFSVLSSGELP